MPRSHGRGGFGDLYITFDVSDALWGHSLQSYVGPTRVNSLNVSFRVWILFVQVEFPESLTEEQRTGIREILDVGRRSNEL